MSEEKSALTALIASKRSDLSEANAKAEALEAALKALKSADISIDWTPKSHSWIKQNYHMAGTPYAKMSQSEYENDDSVIKTAHNDLKDKRDEMVELVSSQLTSARISATGLSAAISLLEATESLIK